MHQIKHTIPPTAAAGNKIGKAAVEATAIVPTDCNAATTLPAATAPPLATATALIMLAAVDPAVIPAAVNPAA